MRADELARLLFLIAVAGFVVVVGLMGWFLIRYAETMLGPLR